MVEDQSGAIVMVRVRVRISVKYRLRIWLWWELDFRPRVSVCARFGLGLQLFVDSGDDEVELVGQRAIVRIRFRVQC